MIDANASTAELDLAASLGIRHVRVATYLNWYEVEKPKLDALFPELEARGIKATLVTTAIGSVCTSADLSADCKAAVGGWHAGLARDYPVEAIEALNEVTAWPPFAGDMPDREKALRIAPLFCAVADSVRAYHGQDNSHGHDMRVMLGVGGTSDEYLGGLKEAGALDCTDVMVIHGYQEIAPQVAQIRKYTVKPIWVTECGADTWDDAVHLETWRRCFDARGVERVYGFALADVNAFGILRDGQPREVVRWLRDLLKEAP